MLEAEVKFALDDASRARLVDRLRELRAEAAPPRTQIDLYFAHPMRSFADSDEALRLRLDDGQLHITYKGPKLDPPRKTREEIELGIDGDLVAARLLLERLGFTPVAEVSKRRRDYHLPAGPGDLPPATVSLDDVQSVGAFCEVEVAAIDVATGRRALDGILARLGLDACPPIATSYLELVLDKRESQAVNASS